MEDSEISIGDINPCPFCGNEDIRVDFGVFANNCVTCIKCEAEGPYGETEEACVKLWNKRVYSVY